MPRLGRVEFRCSYVVDLDDPMMVEDAQLAVYEDVHNSVRFDEVEAWIEVKEDPNANPADIPEFLLVSPIEDNHA